MTHEELKGHFEETLEDLKILLLNTKSGEYATKDDIFRNFQQASQILRIPKEKVMLMYSMKHFISIMDIIEDLSLSDVPEKNKITEKFNDMIAYLILMKTSLLEKSINFYT